MQDKDYLKRCIELAKLGGKSARPNPQVGAMLVYQNRIIGEGYHQRYGEYHAEVNAIQSVNQSDKHLISQSTMYVSLEPCSHTGKTPPCVDLILKHNIPRVVIAEVDPTEKVNHKGIDKLRSNQVNVDVVEMDTFEATSVFKANHLKKRPFIQIKMAKSAFNYIGETEKQIHLTNDTTNIYTHKLRAQTDGILIGTNTALTDNPSLTLRNFPGKPPLRIVMDRMNRIPDTHTLLFDDKPTLIFNSYQRSGLPSNKEQETLDFEDDDFLNKVLNTLIKREVYHVMVEGGAKLIRSFVKRNLWDEAVIIQTKNTLNSGVKAPNINGKLMRQFKLGKDVVFQVRNPNS